MEQWGWGGRAWSRQEMGGGAGAMGQAPCECLKLDSMIRPLVPALVPTTWLGSQGPVMSDGGRGCW